MSVISVAIAAALGLVVVALYLVLSPRLNYDLYRPFLFHPQELGSEDGVAPTLAGVKGQDISFTDSDGYKIYAWYFKQPGSKHTILFSHGNGGNISFRQDTVSLLLHTGSSVLIYDYRGFGRSQGLPTVEGICDDACTAYDYLTKVEGVQPDEIVVYGESLGVGVTTYLASVRSCAGLILQSGFVSLRRIALEVLPGLAVYPQALFPTQTLDSMANLKGKHPPLLIIHGGLDPVVSYKHAADLYAAASQPKCFLPLPTCGHNDLCVAAPHEFFAAVSEFLGGLRGSTASRPPSAVEPGA